MNARKPRTKSKNFSSEETTRLLDLVEEFKPFGGNMWDRVAFEYNRTGQSNWPERDGISLRRRFQGLNNKTKPTGTAYCPPNIERAKRLYSATESKVGAMELHDQQEFGDAASERSDAGSDGNIPQEVSEAVEELVVSSRIGTDAAALLTVVKQEKNKPMLSMTAQRRSSLDNSIEQAEQREAWKREQADQRRREDEQRRQDLLDREDREREARKREQQHEALMMSFMAKVLGNSN
ncbi:hypothetical protein DYB35_009486 [Aphanomyces astaci]|uniref:DUF6818 domain-containing protein n=1 Tax=Aphanomyces astaci TaxID=112090 RepID=A0A3R7BA49_APHAT|nr:hypothetical protein DYB35_009486 [Aphanomyces astaci]